MSHFTAGCPYPHDQCKCCQPADRERSAPPTDLVTAVALAIRDIDGGYADDWSDCALVAVDAVRSWDARHAVLAERDNAIELLRQDVARLTRERDEWEANEQEQYREVQRLVAIVDRYDAFFDDAFPDDPYLKGCLDGEWDAFVERRRRAAVERDERVLARDYGIRPRPPRRAQECPPCRRWDHTNCDGNCSCCVTRTGANIGTPDEGPDAADIGSSGVEQ